MAAVAARASAARPYEPRLGATNGVKFLSDSIKALFAAPTMIRANH